MTLPPPPPASTTHPARTGAVELSVETLVAGAAVFIAATANGPFLGAALRGHAMDAPSTWAWLGALALALAALHVLLLAPWVGRRTVRPVVAAALVVTAVASHYMQRYGIYLDPSMLRNVLRTNPDEAGELITWALAVHLLIYAAAPIAVLARVRVVERPWRPALARRLALIAGAAVVLVGAVLAAFQPLASLMRNQREVRYLITPANIAWSLGVVAGEQRQAARAPRQAIGLDAKPGPSWAAPSRPRVVVLVVGETARAANWGLNGYARDTTPQLARWPLVSYADVTACGTNTEVSLPCMFAPVGRRAYDEARIRGSESLLHVLARAGVDVQWRDNQSGCKGVCEGLASQTVQAAQAPGLCADGRCPDEALGADLGERLARAQGSALWVLHMIGNHGPSYFRRYPPAFERFRPACTDDDLARCSQEQIVNAYDNALLYTDHVLASLLSTLHAQRDRVDAALLYVSDHGESLGERNLYLHGLPYAIAPSEQTRVPMFLWLGEGFARRRGVDLACLAARARQPASHDHLFHTLLTLLDVRTALYEPAWDLTAGCLR